MLQPFAAARQKSSDPFDERADSIRYEITIERLELRIRCDNKQSQNLSQIGKENLWQLKSPHGVTPPVADTFEIASRRPKQLGNPFVSLLENGTPDQNIRTGLIEISPRLLVCGVHTRLWVRAPALNRAVETEDLNGVLLGGVKLLVQCFENQIFGLPSLVIFQVGEGDREAPRIGFR